ncbi:SixA phosphatase family protein [Jiulongibacter sp. NS-SX5]|uniref:SixA phosphatase family protein n=1 Tax=Jiulongibacter sp. NS-SX5 TaxID=3463854 RepID=UPI0040597BD7
MSKKLYIIRHAHAEDLGNVSLVKDSERELTSKGIMQSAKLGRYMKNTGADLGIYNSSPASRARQTASIMMEQYSLNTDELVINEGLYGGGPRGYLACLNQLPEKTDSAAIFGHNPDISFFAEYLTRDDIQGSMKKASVIIMEFEDLKWAEISGNTGTVLQRIDVSDIN